MVWEVFKYFSIAVILIALVLIYSLLFGLGEDFVEGDF